jgi:hypothetical protein
LDAVRACPEPVEGLDWELRENCKVMNTAKPFEVIAARFQISAESAKYFLGHVQKSFKKEKPPQKLIIEFMTGQKFKSMPEPFQVALMLKESGLWVYPLNAEPPALSDEEDIYF